MPNKKKYYIIYKNVSAEIGGSQNLSTIFTIVESEEVAEDWCNRNPYYYYIERICE